MNHLGGRGWPHRVRTATAALTSASALPGRERTGRGQWRRLAQRGRGLSTSYGRHAACGVATHANAHPCGLSGRRRARQRLRRRHVCLAVGLRDTVASQRRGNARRRTDQRACSRLRVPRGRADARVGVHDARVVRVRHGPQLHVQPDRDVRHLASLVRARSFLQVPDAVDRPELPRAAARLGRRVHEARRGVRLPARPVRLHRHVFPGRVRAGRRAAPGTEVVLRCTTAAGQRMSRDAAIQRRAMCPLVERAILRLRRVLRRGQRDDAVLRRLLGRRHRDPVRRRVRASPTFDVQSVRGGSP
jgi:hypothetical protein